MTALGYLYGLLAVGAIMLHVVLWATQKRRARDCSALFASLMLFALWGLTNTANLVYPPWSLLILPPVDLAALFSVVWLYRQSRQWWKIGMGFAFLAQLSLHCVFWFLHFTGDDTPLIQWRYLTGLDAVYLLQVALVIMPGVADGFARLSSLLDRRIPAYQKALRG